MPKYPTERANERDYIYIVKLSSISFLRIGAIAFVTEEGFCLSKLAAEEQERYA